MELATVLAHPTVMLLVGTGVFGMMETGMNPPMVTEDEEATHMHVMERCPPSAKLMEAQAVMTIMGIQEVQVTVMEGMVVPLTAAYIQQDCALLTGKTAVTTIMIILVIQKTVTGGIAATSMFVPPEGNVLTSEDTAAQIIIIIVPVTTGMVEMAVKSTT
jgi:hypothetical protein